MAYLKMKTLSRVQRRTMKKGGYATLINSDKNGKRLQFPASVVDKLSLKDVGLIFITMSEDSLTFSVHKLSEYSIAMPLNISGSQMVIYSADLTAELTEFFSIDYSEKVSHTFYDGRFENVSDADDDEFVLVISRYPKEQEELLEKQEIENVLLTDQSIIEED